MSQSTLALLMGSLLACAASPAPMGSPDGGAQPGCDRERYATFFARGDLDGALEAVADCAVDANVELARMRALAELGEVALAKEIAKRLEVAASPDDQRAIAEVLALADLPTSPTELVREGRLRAAEATKLALTDPPAAARAYGRARHLFEHATGVSSRRVAIDSPAPIGFSGPMPLWSVALREPSSTKASESRFMLVTERAESGALVPTAALDLGRGELTTVTPWPGAHSGVLLTSPTANALWREPWLAPVSVPAGPAAFDSSGARLVVREEGGLGVFATRDGSRVFAIPAARALGNGACIGTTLYAETGASSEGALVVDIAKGVVLVDEAEAIGAAVSPSGTHTAWLRVATKPASDPRLELVVTELSRPSKPPLIVDVGYAPIGSFPSAVFDADRGVAVVRAAPSAMMHEGDTILTAYVSLASRRAGEAPKEFEWPDRSIVFARLAKLTEPSLTSPRVAIAHWAHSQTFDEDRASGRAVVVTGVPLKWGFPSHAENPSLVFVDVAAKKVLRDVGLPAADLTIVDVTLAPGGRSAVVFPRDGASLLVDADTGEVASGNFDGAWSADGEQRITASGLWALHAKGAAALVHTPLPIAADKEAIKPLEEGASGEVVSGRLCLIGTLLAPSGVCR